MVNEAAAVPPKVTAVAVLKLLPVMTIDEPVYPDVAANEEIVGGRFRNAPSLPMAKY